MIPAPITLAIIAVAYFALCFGLPMLIRWILRAVDDPTDPDDATLTHHFNHRGNNLSDTSGAKVTGRTHGGST